MLRLVGSVFLFATAFADEPLTLHYLRPAAEWIEALPIGNGRFGAMVFGGIHQERLQLNEDTLWAGGPYDPSNPQASAALPAVRQLIAEKKFTEAQQLAQETMMARPLGQMPYQTMADVMLTFSGSNSVSQYRRELNLDRAIATTTFTTGTGAWAVRQTRETFASAADHVIVMRLAAEQSGSPRGQLSFALSATSLQHATAHTIGGDTLILQGRNGRAESLDGALSFQTRVKVTTDGGRVTSDGQQLHIDGARSAVIIIAAATSFRRFDDVRGDPNAANEKTLRAVEGRSYEELRVAHVTEHQRLFRRVALDLGHSAAEALPTDERVRRFAEGGDPALAALYFQYGRYLLISSSRPGTQPANLQGIWNNSLTPPWGSKYTLNINAQMNYWPAEITNLAECAEPLFDMIHDLSITGAKVARTNYNAPGWVAHHNTDLWRAAAPVDGARWGLWPTGGAWLCLHLWEHYRFSNDREFLARTYPLMKGAAEFFIATLVPEKTGGWLVTSPSLSPENAHHGDISIAEGPAMDSQILRDLFDACSEAARILGQDVEFQTRLEQTRVRLAPLQIGAQGQLKEWLEDWDVQAPEPHHRHVSHLYALYPSEQIDVRTTPELAAAARHSLEQRGDDATGWAIGWRLNLWARLHDAQRAYDILNLLLRPERTYPNLFDAHPPFQIDGNFGGTAGIAEMLLQSHGGVIQLLPALPSAWPSGMVRGLRTRGGFELAELSWKNGQLVRAEILSHSGGECRVLSNGKMIVRSTRPGETFTLTPAPS